MVGGLAWTARTEAKTWGTSVHCPCKICINGKRERDICLLASCRKYFNVHLYTQREDKKGVCVCVCVCVCEEKLYSQRTEEGENWPKPKGRTREGCGHRAEIEWKTRKPKNTPMDSQKVDSFLLSPLDSQKVDSFLLSPLDSQKVDSFLLSPLDSQKVESFLLSPLDSQKVESFLLSPLDSQKVDSFLLSPLDSQKVDSFLLSPLDSQKVESFLLSPLDSQKVDSFLLSLLDSQKVESFLLRWCFAPLVWKDHCLTFCFIVAIFVNSDSRKIYFHTFF